MKLSASAESITFPKVFALCGAARAESSMHKPHELKTVRPRGWI